MNQLPAIITAVAILVVAINQVLLIRRVERLERRRPPQAVYGTVVVQPTPGSLSDRYFNGGKSSVEREPQS